MGPMHEMKAFNAYLECQAKYSSDGKKPSRRPFITLSREYGAGGHTVARLLENYLHKNGSGEKCPWTLFDHDLVQLALKEHNLPASMEKYLPEGHISETRDIMEELAGLHPPAFVLVRDVSETILHLARMGYAIIVGRGGNFITSSLEEGLRVRLVGSHESRRRHLEELFSISRDEAEKRIKREDHLRGDYIKQNFGRDIEDPVHYDLIINTDRISYEDAAAMIGDEVLRMEKRLQI